MNRKPRLITVCSTLLAAVAVIGISAGCGKGKDTTLGTDGATPPARSQIEAGPAGHWEADIVGDGPRTNRVTLDLAKNAKSEWVASMGVPSENMTGMVVTDVAVNGKSVKFVAVELMMASFDLTQGPEGSMKGTVFGQSAHPVEFKRTGEAKVELIPASPAVSKELEGDWEASIGPPDGSFQLAFHFKNQPDNTVAATMDSRNAGRNLNAVGMPLNDVKQAGQKVEFGIKIGGSSFQGTMNKEGTEIAGQLNAGPTPTPLTLRKK